MFPLRDTIPSARVPVVTMGIIMVNALVFLSELSTSTCGVEDIFYSWGIVPCYFIRYMSVSLAHAVRFSSCATASQLLHAAILDFPAWWMDAHHWQYVVAVDFW